MIRPPTAPTAPPTAAPRAAPCPPAAAAPIAAPLPAPMRPPPIIRWTGSYGLVQADKPRTSPTATTRGVIPSFVISLFSNDYLDHCLIGRLGSTAVNGPLQERARQIYIPKKDTLRRHPGVSFLVPWRAIRAARPLSVGYRAQMCERKPKDAHSWFCRGGDACSDRADRGACSSAGVGHGTTQDGPSARRRPSVGWLWLGLAPSARSLEPVERGMGSPALRAKPL